MDGMKPIATSMFESFMNTRNTFFRLVAAFTICANVVSGQEEVSVVQPETEVRSEDATRFTEPLEEVAGIRDSISKKASSWLPGIIAESTLRPTDSSLLFRPSAANYLQNDRGFALQNVNWSAPGTYSKPTYFEDIDLENYGHRKHLQMPRSALKFFGGIPLLPIKMLHQPPRQCVYRLGPDRPGNRNCSVKEKMLR